MYELDELIEYEQPQIKLPTMLVAFAGWPDAAEAATRAVRFLVRKLHARKFAEIDPEEFYDFTHVRPHSRVNSRGERVIRWPKNDLYYYPARDASRSLLLFVGTEPNLRWRAYSQILACIAQRHQVELIVSLGALLDAVPHTREPHVTGRASSQELTQKAEWLGIKNSGYQGPTGIHTAFTDACAQAGMTHASIWGHCPHYVNTSPDPKVSYALLTRLRSLIDIDVDLEEMQIAGNAYQEEVNKVIARQPDVSNYVRRLEKRYDDARSVSEEIPSPETMVQELENFLKSQNRPEDDPDETAPS